MPISKHHKINLRLVVTFLVAIMLLILSQQLMLKKQRALLLDFPKIQERGELRALTIYSSTSYYIYRDREMGYEYELCSKLAESLGVRLKMIPVSNINALLDSLDTGAGDIIAYNVPLSMEIKNNYNLCGREYITHQVLVQDNYKDNGFVSDVTQLIGKEIVVQKGSRYYKRLVNLNNELGGGIIIRTLDEDSITTEELIGQVASGEIKYTIADDALAKLNETYYKNLNVSLIISFPQHSFWVARKSSPLLAAKVNDWFRKNVHSQQYEEINKRYFEINKGFVYHTFGLSLGKDGRISPYDNLFKKYGKIYDMDWRLLASIAYQESNFEADAVSWAGAKGLMQIMPRTAGAFGISPDSLFFPDVNILAAVRLLKDIRKSLGGIKEEDQRKKLVLAGFNSGIGQLHDARALTKKYGNDPNKWDNNVKRFVILKSQPKYYQDEVCQQGYLRGEETAAFVTEVWTRYKYYIKMGIK
jgi:membrane-bound lytic murein transglycosylase F